MQTHMPYGKKYPDKNIAVTGDVDTNAIADYLTDIEYSSHALLKFLEELKQVDRRTIVVFWGDHLPAIYSDEFQASLNPVDLHLTEFLLYDTADELKDKKNNQEIISPFYFTSTMVTQAGLKQAPMDRLLQELSSQIPAFEKTHAYQNGEWQERVSLDNKHLKTLYHDYQLIQYDIVAGKQYSLKTGFFD